MAGLISCALMAKCIDPVVLLVAGDDRMFKYRHPLPTSNTIQTNALLVLCGRRSGLICSCSRMVCFDDISIDISNRYMVSLQADVAGITSSVPGTTMDTVFNAMKYAYKNGGFENQGRDNSLQI